MCLIALAHRVHPRYPLILLANRDELHARPTRPSGFWPEHPHLLAGCDLQAGGTWMGVTRTGRLAALTNVREPALFEAGRPSRGALVLDFLLDHRPPAAWLAHLQPRPQEYNGFNLLLGDREGLFYLGNRGGEPPRLLPPGSYGLSNAALDTPWPKVRRLKTSLQKYLRLSPKPTAHGLLPLLDEREQAPDADLPHTGVGLVLERLLSAICIVSPAYGTRSSTAVLLDTDGRLQWVEQVRAPDGLVQETRLFELQFS